MLEHCAPGYTSKPYTHNWAITFGSRVYPSLPRGAHGKRTNSEIEVGHVKKMARYLKILDCAKEFLPQLR